MPHVVDLACKGSIWKELSLELLRPQGVSVCAYACAGNLLYINTSSSQRPETGLLGLYVAVRTHPLRSILEPRGSRFCSGFHAGSQAYLSVHVCVCRGCGPYLQS